MALINLGIFSLKPMRFYFLAFWLNERPLCIIYLYYPILFPLSQDYLVKHKVRTYIDQVGYTNK